MENQGGLAPGEGVLGGALTGDQGDESAKLPARIERYSKAQARKRSMLDHLRSNDLLPDERALLFDCGNYLLFHDYYTVGKVRLAAMRSCDKHLLCPLCAIRRGSKALKAYLDRFRVITAENPDLVPYLVTFTVVNGYDLSERMGHLRRSVQRLHGRRWRYLKGKRGAPWSEAARAAGAVWTYEVTNKGKGWHPHVHAIWLCASPPDQDALQAEWLAITADSYIVDVRPISQADPASGFCEVFKYAMKFSELSMADNVEAYLALRGLRLVGSLGKFRDVQVPAQLTDELLEDLPYVEILYRYFSRSGYNVQSISEPMFQGQPLSLSPA